MTPEEQHSGNIPSFLEQAEHAPLGAHMAPPEGLDATRANAPAHTDERTRAHAAEPAPAPAHMADHGHAASGGADDAVDLESSTLFGNAPAATAVASVSEPADTPFEEQPTLFAEQPAPQHEHVHAEETASAAQPGQEARRSTRGQTLRRKSMSRP